MENEIRDPELWKIAKKRAEFKYHALIYFIINIILWAMWYIGLRTGNTPYFERGIIPWPAWATVGWGIGLFFHYWGVYKTNDSMARREYDRLAKKNKEHNL